MPSRTQLQLGMGRTYAPICQANHSLSRANQCEEAPHCTAGRIVQVRDSLLASLLERKQEEKICVYNIPEGGA